MRQLVALTFVALCSAELGYQYQPANGPAFGYETNAGLTNSYGNQETTDHNHEHADYHKHFYAFEAPYSSDDEADLLENKLSALSKKNLQVVFIKAPENKAVESALHALAKQTSEDKTAIYVLNKQTDTNELASKLSALQTQNKNKPEVHFVKYRTEEEAAQAQQLIQAQYGGITGQSSQPLQRPSLGYLPPAELSQQGYYPQKLPRLPSSSPQPNYLPPLPNYGNVAQQYDAGADQGQLDLPPLPLPEQQLSTSHYNLDARSARSLRIDYRVNERHRSGSRMVFPDDATSRTYQSSSYQPAQKRRRRAHF